MSESVSSSKAIKRASLLYVVILLFGLVFIGRLFYLQVVKHDYYSELALAEHQSKFSIPSERGTISALDGNEPVPLVLNQNRPTVFADPRFIEDKDTTANTLAEILDTNAQELRQLLDSNSSYVVLAKKVTVTQAKRVERAELDGIGLSDRDYRVYPQGQLASQLLGFVNDEGEGQYGFEEYLNADLAGKNGRLKAVTDVYGIPLSTSDENVIDEPVNGRNVTLTIDINIQRFVEQAVKKGVKSSGGKSGSAIVIDPHTGAIKAMANYPTYNPNDFGEVKDLSRFLNPVTDSAYETGSGMKIFTMTAGLNEGAVTKSSTYYDAGYEVVDGHKIENAEGGGGTRTMLDVIQHSVNTGVIHVLKQMGGGSINERGRKTLYKYFSKLYGFGHKTGVEQVNEAKGTIIEPTTGAGDNIRYANMAFGQGLTVTMMQMAAGASALLNGGDYYQPHLIHSTVDNQGQVHVNEPMVIRNNIVKANATKQIKEMMRAVVVGGGGYSAQRDGYFIGGKTGTAQIPDESGGYTEYREIGSFIGFGATKNIDYVVMTRVNEPTIGGYAGTVAAAPIFTDISNFLIDYYQIPPDR